jgi:uncharacterized Tic20 family protein
MSEEPPKPPPIAADPPSPLVPPPGRDPVLNAAESQARTWNMFCHLSVLAGLVLPLGNLWVPLLIWQIKKHEIPSVIVNGKAAINFQLTVILWFLASIALVFSLTFFCVGYFLIFLPGLIALVGLIFPIINGIKVNHGEPYAYPCLIDFVK